MHAAYQPADVGGGGTAGEFARGLFILVKATAIAGRRAGEPRAIGSAARLRARWPESAFAPARTAASDAKAAPRGNPAASVGVAASRAGRLRAGRRSARVRGRAERTGVDGLRGPAGGPADVSAGPAVWPRMESAWPGPQAPVRRSALGRIGRDPAPKRGRRPAGEPQARQHPGLSPHRRSG